MSLPPVWILGAAAAAFLLTIRYVLVKKSKGYQRLPPGPKGYPFIGNALEFPTTDQAKVFKAKFSHYGVYNHLTISISPLTRCTSRYVPHGDPFPLLLS